jgi:undecaprenyl-diphosphatase
MDNLDSFNIFLTTVFSTETLLIVIGLVLIDLFRREQTRAALWLVASTLMMVALVIVLKDYFAVVRPASALITLDSYAFPSGHATSIAFLVTVLWWYGRSVLLFSKEWLGFGLVILFILVGWSRIYLQVHTIDQVLAGYALGAIVGGFFYWQVRNRPNIIKNS